MSQKLKIFLPIILVCCVIALAIIWRVSWKADPKTPKSLCGTPVSTTLSEPLLEPPGEVSERNRVDKNKPTIGESCIVRVDGAEAIEFEFSWHAGTIDPLKYASPGHEYTTTLQNPKRVEGLGAQAVLGDDGAFVTAPCKSSIDGIGGPETTDEFSLFMRASRDVHGDDRRESIEKFMRAYFPATLETLNCT
ncbi:hypothetical protein AB0C70_22860 [Streptomyces sp. NPDC048564]|uniref:hypothetical protein n=1 Tax=Streptomyces sp. NPDC048564 TaxID=3155760 RepID=UPI0034410258